MHLNKFYKLFYRSYLHYSASKILAFLILLLSVNGCEEGKLSPQPASISFNKPSGGEVFIQDASYTLSWRSSGVKSVDIDLESAEGNIYKVADNILNSGIFQWTVDASIPADNEYVLIIYDSEDSTVISELRQPIKLLSRFESSSFIDLRDGREYSTVKIGEDWWMAENFRYETDNGSIYYNELDSLGLVYGRLYTLDAARDSAPEGWHLPTDEDWINLELFLGINNDVINTEGSRSHYIGDLLKVGGGTGFNALYGGYYNTIVGRCGHIYQEAHFWTSTYNQDDQAIIRIISKFDGGIMRLATLFHSGCSVRYVMDK